MTLTKQPQFIDNNIGLKIVFCNIENFVVGGKLSVFKDEDIEKQPEQYKDDTSSTGSANQVIEVLQVRLYLLSKMIVY
jgi:hypothetical protein